jgi:hypothetical protein
MSLYKMWWHMAVIPATQEAEVERSRFKAGPRQSKTLPKKQTKAKSTGSMAQVVEHLPSKQVSIVSIIPGLTHPEDLWKSPHCPKAQTASSSFSSVTCPYKVVLLFIFSTSLSDCFLSRKQL